MADLQEMYESLVEATTKMNREILTRQVDFTEGINAELSTLKREIVKPLCRWGISCGTRLHGWELRFNTRKGCWAADQRCAARALAPVCQQAAQRRAKRICFPGEEEDFQDDLRGLQQAVDSSMTSSVVSDTTMAT